MKNFLLKVYKKLSFADDFFTKVDKQRIRRTKNLLWVPDIFYRRGGKASYGEWCHVIGIFQTFIYNNLKSTSGNRILDVGSGTGLLAIAAEPMVTDNGLYTGIDVIAKDVEFCRERYNRRHFRFQHHKVLNPTYSPDQPDVNLPWQIDANSMDLVTALSVWTHLKERDALYYLKEVARVLKPGGRAIITFFYMEEQYKASLKKRSNAKGRYHQTEQSDWVFDMPAYSSKHWFCPKWVKAPEDAIGVDKAGMKQLLETSGLILHQVHHGNWKEQPGAYFQDILVFEKKV